VYEQPEVKGMPMSGNASHDVNELGQCLEFITAAAKGLALIAPQMTKQARQSWIGVGPETIAELFAKQIFLPSVAKAEDSQSIIIDLDADPFVPDGWKVEKHIKGGQFAFDPSAVKLHLDAGQQGGKSIQGHKLRKRLEKEPVMNANQLDWYLANPQHIPEEWKGKYVFFWGTIYRRRGGGLFVRYLCWGVDRWGWGGYWLDDGWRGDGPAAVRAS
jgi:hypothetical protein